MFYKVLRSILSFIFKVIYHPQVINKSIIPKTGPIILAGNHTNNFDCLILFLTTKRKIHFLAKKELLDSKLKWIYKKMGIIPVDRSKKNNEAIKLAIEALKNNEIVVIFPEGTINKSNEVVLPFKYGTVSISSKTNAPIIPFAITGKYKFRSKNLKIELGKPLQIKKDLESYNQDLTNKVIELITKS